MATEALRPAADAIEALMEVIDDELVHGVKSYSLRMRFGSGPSKKGEEKTVLFEPVNIAWRCRTLTPVLEKDQYLSGVWNILNTRELIQQENKCRNDDPNPRPWLDLAADCMLSIIETRSTDHLQCAYFNATGWSFHPSIIYAQMKCRVCSRKRKFWIALNSVHQLLTRDALWVISDLGAYGSWPGWEISADYAYLRERVQSRDILRECPIPLAEMHEISKCFRAARSKKYETLPPVWQPILALGTLLGICIGPDLTIPFKARNEEEGVCYDLYHQALWYRQGHTQYWHTNNKNSSTNCKEPYGTTSTEEMRKTAPKTRPLDFFDADHWCNFRGSCDPGEPCTALWHGSLKGLIRAGLLDADQHRWDDDYDDWVVDDEARKPAKTVLLPHQADWVVAKRLGKGLHIPWSVRSHVISNPFGIVTVQKLRNGETGTTESTYLPRPHTWLITDHEEVARENEKCSWELADCNTRKQVLMCHGRPADGRSACLSRKECLMIHDSRRSNDTIACLRCSCQEDVLRHIGWPCGGTFRLVNPDFPEDHLDSTSAYFEREHLVVQEPLVNVLRSRQVHACRRDLWMQEVPRLSIVPQENHRSIRYIQGQVPLAFALLKALLVDSTGRYMPSPAIYHNKRKALVLNETLQCNQVDEVAGFSHFVSPVTATYLTVFDEHFLRFGRNAVGPRYMNEMMDDCFGVRFPKDPRFEELWDIMKWFAKPEPLIFFRETEEGYQKLSVKELEARLPHEIRSEMQTVREQFRWPSEHLRKRHDAPTPMCENPLFSGHGCNCETCAEFDDFIFM